MNFLKTRLTKRYSLIVFVVILFVLSSIYIITVNIVNSSVREQIEQRDQLASKTLGNYIDSKLTTILNDLRISSYYNTRENKQAYKSEMESIVSNDPLYLQLKVFDKNGNVLSYVPKLNYQEPNRVDFIRDRLSWSKTPYISTIMELPNGKKSLAIAYPSLKNDVEFHGGVIAYLDLNTLSSYLKKFVIGSAGINMIVDRNGVVLAHSNNEYIGTDLDNHPLTENLQKDRFGLWQGSLFNEKMIATYRPLQLGKLGLVVGETERQAMAPARSLESLLIKGFIVVFAIALFLTFIGASRVIKPILNLVKQVNEYKENKRTNFDHLKTKDEIEDLSLVLEQMATELTEKERKLFYILESIPYCIITTDHYGTITSFSNGAEKLTKYKKEEVIGESIFDFPSSPPNSEFILSKTLKEGKELDEYESYIYDRKGSRQIVKIYSSVFKAPTDTHLGTIMVIRNVSDIKKMEDYLKQRERLSSLGQLTAGIAHEIKNPLNIIQTAAEAITMETDNEQEIDANMVQELANDIIETSDRMNHLLTDFLQLTKGEETSSETEVVNITEVIEELLQTLGKNTEFQDIVVNRSYDATDSFVSGNRNQLTQVFLNILLNSIEVMKDGGTLSVSIKALEGEWKVEVSDTGPGIPEKELKWIFNPFYSTKNTGTGLGLSISHEIIKRYNGEIWAESQQGKGTSIIIKLPNKTEENIT